MPTNTGNIDNQKAKATSDPSSHSAPKEGASGYVELGNSDQNPERIERLGNYLSNTTKNTTDDERNAEAYGNTNKNPDPLGISHTSGKQKADFPIGSPGTRTETIEEEYNTSVQGAIEWFKNLSKDGETFSEENIASVITQDIRESESPNLRHGSGHSLLTDDERARKLVAKEIEVGKSSNVSNSRWAGVGTKKFPRRRLRRSTNEITRGVMDDIRSVRGIEESHGSKYGDFERPGMPNIKDYTGEDMPKYWDDYFNSLKRYGPALKKKAANMDLDADNDERKARKGSFGGSFGMSGGNITEADLGEAYSKVDLNDLTPEETIGQFDNENVANDAIPINEQTHNDSSYGHFYTANAPFQPGGFPGMNGSLELVGVLTEIWVAMSVKISVVAAVIEAGNLGISEIGNLVTGKRPYNNSYYSDPQTKNPTDYEKGESGWRPNPSNAGQKGIDALIKSQAQNEERKGPVIVGSQLVLPVAASILDIVDEEATSLLQNVAREMNIYVPRHIMTEMKNRTGSYGFEKGFKGAITQMADVATAYIRAVTAGFAVFAANIVGRDVGRSVGYYRTILKEIVRSQASNNDRYEMDTSSKSGWEDFLRGIGKDNKLMSFMNHLAMIGDLGVARGVSGYTGFTENKVPLDYVQNYPTLRTASTRIPGDKKSRLSLTETPSMMLKPSNAHTIMTRLENLGFGGGEYVHDGWNQTIHKQGSYSNSDFEELSKRYRKPENSKSRFSPKEVQIVEDQLEAEHMPFYIQDLRTNEIISFHAFLNSLSDSYTGEWSGVKGFGRLEAAQIYGGGSRSIGVSFTMAAMNQEDFDEMYMKINKLTTLVYPQWSEGTLVQQGENKFVQPFSQVPTASPLCRIRIGEIFASNYSKTAMARMMGVGNNEFKYNDVDIKETEIKITPLKNTYYLTRNGFNAEILGRPKADGSGVWTKEDWAYPQRHLEKLGPWQVVVNSTSDSIGLFTGPDGKELYEDLTGNNMDSPEEVFKWLDTFTDYSLVKITERIEAVVTADAEDRPHGISQLFDSQFNPVFKAFESSMGRGIAVAINSIGIDWKLNSAPWNLMPGERAPRMCEITLGLIPIHDITPGLDHTGINRAPIYKVGSSRKYTGDVWHNQAAFGDLVSEIKTHEKNAMEGRLPVEPPQATEGGK